MEKILGLNWPNVIFFFSEAPWTEFFSGNPTNQFFPCYALRPQMVYGRPLSINKKIIGFSVYTIRYFSFILRMYCIDTKALVFRGRPLLIWGARRKNRKWIYFFGKTCVLSTADRNSSYGFIIHINNEMYKHHCLLALRGYLCSTSLKSMENKERITF